MFFTPLLFYDFKQHPNSGVHLLDECRIDSELCLRHLHRHDGELRDVLIGQGDVKYQHTAGSVI